MNGMTSPRPGCPRRPLPALLLRQQQRFADPENAVVNAGNDLPAAFVDTAPTCRRRGLRSARRFRPEARGCGASPRPRPTRTPPGGSPHNGRNGFAPAVYQHHFAVAVRPRGYEFAEFVAEGEPHDSQVFVEAQIAEIQGRHREPIRNRQFTRRADVGTFSSRGPGPGRRRKDAPRRNGHR